MALLFTKNGFDSNFFNKHLFMKDICKQKVLKSMIFLKSQVETDNGKMG